MEFKTPGSQLFVPDGAPIEEAIVRTNYLGISCHQDDLEIMAFDGIIECYQDPDKWFSGVVVTNGGGAPRADIYADYTDEMMMEVRAREQKKAAYVGEYGFQALLHYPSSAVKDPANQDPTEEIRALIEKARPTRVYTHNLADKHDTHVAVAVAAINACRALPPETRPQQVLGCEVWRDLDWMHDADKIVLDCTGHENLQAALLGIYDSQVCGGKRYDLATLGRRRAHATYHESHGVDVAEMLTFAMDLTPLVTDPELEITQYVKGFVDRFYEDVADRIAKATG